MQTKIWWRNGVCHGLMEAKKHHAVHKHFFPSMRSWETRRLQSYVPCPLQWHHIFSKSTVTQFYEVQEIQFLVVRSVWEKIILLTKKKKKQTRSVAGPESDAIAPGCPHPLPPHHHHHHLLHLWQACPPPSSLAPSSLSCPVQSSPFLPPLAPLTAHSQSPLPCLPASSGQPFYSLLELRDKKEELARTLDTRSRRRMNRPIWWRIWRHRHRVHHGHT